MPKDDTERELRMCRVDGRVPTTRDMWRAFHRLWRLSQGHGSYRDMEAIDCFRTLFPSWRWIRLLDAPPGDGLVNNSRFPLPIRKRLLQTAINRRLRSRPGETRERDAAVSNLVREKHGIEVTPDQVAEIRYKVLRQVQEIAILHGKRPPETMQELGAILKGAK